MAIAIQKLTLVMGARGRVGRHVLNGLLKCGVPVRAPARRPEPGQFPSGVDVVTAARAMHSVWRARSTGSSRCSCTSHRDGVQGVVDAAPAAGVRRIVLMSSGSVIHPTSRGHVITEEHRAVEEVFGQTSI